jgi:cephalosporin-C deacetylase-like acetyl esterase
MKNILLVFAFLQLFINVAVGQLKTPDFAIGQSNETGIYKAGETVNLIARFPNPPRDSVGITTRTNFEPKSKKQRLKADGKELEVFENVFVEPTSITIEVKAGEETESTGLVVAPEKFQPGTARPKDFDKYWKKEKKTLRKLPMKIKSESVEITEKGFLCYDMEINCTGPKPARGYFAKPESSQPKSLPIVLFVHAAGVKGDWCLSKPETAVHYAKTGNGALAFDLNAHGMLNGQPREYYAQLEEGELKGYFYQGIENREEFYFRGMYLRLLRTLDFLCGQPEWDGKRIIVIGESQGDGQALAAAGLDERVSAAVAIVPAMCDWGGPDSKTRAGWPQPFSQNGDMKKMLKTLPYFDTAHLLKNSKATLFVEIGFIDPVCPSTSIYAAINQSNGDKIILGVPYRGHQLDQKQFQKTWEETVYRPRIAFINNFLK